MAMAVVLVDTDMTTYQYMIIQRGKAQRLCKMTFALLILHLEQRSSLEHGLGN